MSMHAIISHDVDHLCYHEHWRDLIIPKLLARMVLERARGAVGTGELARRLGDILRDKRENLLEVLDFDNAHGIRPTFFIGMSRGLGLSYSSGEAGRWVRRLAALDCDLGLHGIAFRDEDEMRRERDLFASHLGRRDFGIRMHYLRRDADTQSRLARLGYTFDTTVPDDRGPWRTPEGMWTFPLHVMDGWYLCGTRRFQSASAAEALQVTRARIDELLGRGVDFLTINFHDCYYSPAYRSWKEWYERVVDHLGDRGARFVTYPQAMALLEQGGRGPATGEAS
jgi:hypothetical protein